MALKSRHAFGNSANISAALTAGTIDEYDILFLDGDTEPKIGWIDAKGEIRIIENEATTTIVDGDSLPETGEVGKIYIFNDEAYVYNGTEYKSISKSADLTALEAEIANKASVEKVQEMIEAYAETESEVVEF